MVTFFKKTVLDELLETNLPVRMFMSHIKTPSFNAEEYFKKINTKSDLDFIIKIAHHSPEFEAMCKDERRHLLWDGLHTLLGLYISTCEHKTTLFFKYEGLDRFDLFRGEYLFHLSQLERQMAQSDFSFGELQLLKEAIRFKSIHALQRYKQYVDQKIASHVGTIEEQRNLWHELIDNCKNMHQSQGSYADMMLADVYLHYALWSFEHSDLKGAKRAFKAAKDSCDLAEKYLDRSQYSIHNASLGEGLKCSNSFEQVTPAALKNTIEECWHKQNNSLKIY